MRVSYGPSQGKALCRCGVPYYGHRPKGGACYALGSDCTAFAPAVNGRHRWSVAPRKTTVYLDHKYDSIAEAQYAQDLQSRLKAKDIKSWRPHPRIELTVNGNRVVDYRMDFEVEHFDGKRELVEVKGNPARTPLWQLKWKILNAMFRDDPMTIIRLVSV